MGDPDENILSGLPFGSLYDALSSLELIYRELGSATFDFASRAGLACPSGCGSCCEGFVPDLLPLEAAWLGAWLIRHEPERARALAERGISDDGGRGRTCPFYRPENDQHCGVYAGRPLICRLFAFSAIRAKEGGEAFALCRHLPARAGSPARIWSGAGIEAEFGSTPPVMADYARRVALLRPGEQGERQLLPEALPAALRRLFLLLGMEERSGGGDEDPERPLPLAS